MPARTGTHVCAAPHSRHVWELDLVRVLTFTAVVAVHGISATQHASNEYHLYFLVVTLQIYLVFPFLIRPIRSTARYALPVLALVLVLNLAWLGVLQYGHFHGWLFSNGYELFPTYTIYILAGAYAALHWERIRALLAASRRRILVVAGAAGLAALGAYAAQLGWMSPVAASAVTQPATFASCVAMILLLFHLAERWTAAGMPGRRTVVLASEISFGVYLAHPMFLQLLLDHGLGMGHQILPSPLATVAGIVGAIVGASTLTLAARRTPLALPLTGRATSRGRRVDQLVPVTRETLARFPVPVRADAPVAPGDPQVPRLFGSDHKQTADTR